MAAKGKKPTTINADLGDDVQATIEITDVTEIVRTGTLIISRGESAKLMQIRFSNTQTLAAELNRAITALADLERGEQQQPGAKPKPAKKKGEEPDILDVLAAAPAPRAAAAVIEPVEQVDLTQVQQLSF